jgi:hypothetical protein
VMDYIFRRWRWTNCRSRSGPAWASSPPTSAPRRWRATAPPPRPPRSPRWRTSTSRRSAARRRRVRAGDGEGSPRRPQGGQGGPLLGRALELVPERRPTRRCA